jgi:hypothetical protein
MTNRMRTNTRSNSISSAEASFVPRQGVRILAQDKKYFLSIEQYPWLCDARIAEIRNVGFFHGHHLRWPELGIELDTESLESPEDFPLIYRETKMSFFEEQTNQ